jgi:hypothetical protein
VELQDALAQAKLCAVAQAKRPVSARFLDPEQAAGMVRILRDPLILS